MASSTRFSALRSPGDKRGGGEEVTAADPAGGEGVHCSTHGPVPPRSIQPFPMLRFGCSSLPNAILKPHWGRFWDGGAAVWAQCVRSWERQG